ncbi:DUF395-domain-containing protein [Basidiobolus meristosporus CBS 931.73]|uniref:DUF395-domain-containing protein n=1 Tax=Basidiobolus meristosporus CBS 931.73 TaxID=1314790 RepID=A0A1Y1XRV6_9FUNG|nr:DUF395-domain-containing protein [Basidiobolus meristosporus CBS 931.73]|eukprot:ORX88499.1 DUF395-domain-containing protein [Basidiobolus meristosporus CBS 931.73]
MFTPVESLAGGLLLSTAAYQLLTCNGRIMGASGIFAGSVKGGEEGVWRIYFLSGMASSAILVRLFGPAPPAFVQPSEVIPIIGGLLVGFGSRLGSGCTSGHMICGVSRLSPRSIVATATFFSTGLITANLMNKLYPDTLAEGSTALQLPSIPAAVGLLGLPYLAILAYRMVRKLADQNAIESVNARHITALLSGFFFSLGLSISGMSDPAKVLNFLRILSPSWDPSLAFVALGGLIPYGILYQKSVKQAAKPALAPQFEIPTSTVIDQKLITGASIFGVGWGLAGVCPGPAIVGAVASGAAGPLVFLASMAVGMLAYGALF